MASGLNTERIYIVSISLAEEDEPSIGSWINDPPGARTPGPYPLPVQHPMQVGSGFPAGMPAPILEFDRPRADALRSAYQFSVYWCVSDSVKRDLFGLDAAAFDAVLSETRFPDGSVGPPMWLMEVIRYCDCLDVERSLAAGARLHSSRDVIRLGVVNQDRAFFRKSALGDAHFFRMPPWPLRCLCTERAKQVIESAAPGIFSFLPSGWLV